MLTERAGMRASAIDADNAGRPRHRTPGSGTRSSGEPPLGDEVGQVLQRVVEVVLPERRDLDVLAQLGRHR
jgi:hypothetical protein